jgi:hypothetical protein
MTSRAYVFTLFPDIDAYPLRGDLDTQEQLACELPYEADLWVSPGVRYVTMQVEKCPLTDSYHLQGYLELVSPARIAGVRGLLPVLALHNAHLEPRKGTRDQARAYAQKDDTRVLGPWEYGNWIGGGQGHRSDVSTLAQGVLAGRTDRELALEAPEAFMRLSRGVQDLRAAITERPSDAAFDPYPWQRSVLDRLSEPADDRHILWVRDSIGGRGKSRLTRHLCLTQEAFFLSGRLQDMMYAFAQCAPAFPKIVIFDISRAQAEHSDHLYTMAENLKNGQFFSTKYVSRLVFFTPPHVLFFSNALYDQSKWSADRVQLVDLDIPVNPVVAINMGRPFM